MALMVRVLPANMDMIKHLKHPNTGVPRLTSLQTPVEWPLDQFTARRIAEGSIIEFKDEAQAESKTGSGSRAVKRK